MAKPISYNFISGTHAQVFVRGELVGWINYYTNKDCWIFHPLPEESFKGAVSVDLEELKEMVEGVWLD